MVRSSLYSFLRSKIILFFIFLAFSQTAHAGTGTYLNTLKKFSSRIATGFSTYLNTFARTPKISAALQTIAKGSPIPKSLSSKPANSSFNSYKASTKFRAFGYFLPPHYRPNSPKFFSTYRPTVGTRSIPWSQIFRPRTLPSGPRTPSKVLVIDRLEHGSRVSQTLLEGDSSLIEVIQKNIEADSVAKEVEEAYRSGCRVVNFSTHPEVSQADLSKYPTEWVERNTQTLSKQMFSLILKVVETQVEPTLSPDNPANNHLIMEITDASIKRLHDPQHFPIQFPSEFRVFLRKLSSAIENNLTTYSSFNIDSYVEAIKSHPDMVFVVSAGNSGTNLNVARSKEFVLQKLNLPNVIVVGSTDAQGNLSRFSNYGKEVVHLAAKGESYFVKTSGGNTKLVSGTSFSAAQVSRTLAKVIDLLTEINPNYGIKEAISILKASLKKSESLKDLAWGGALDESQAIELAKSVRDLLLYPELGFN